MLVATLATSGASSDCGEKFEALRNSSNSYAAKHEYVEAAAVRDAAARQFAHCASTGESTTMVGQFPLDGVFASIVAAAQWHAAGYDDQANLDVAIVSSEIHRVEADSRLNSAPGFAVQLQSMKEMLRAEQIGKWPSVSDR